ncbi:MAG TPA: hypothetical protein VF053_21805 [Streptosporangiales bacterium]
MTARGTCRVTDLTAVGNTARGFDAASNDSDKALGKAEDSSNGARAGRLKSVGTISDLRLFWSAKFGSQGVDLHTIGDQLVGTANAYAHGDQAPVDEFKYVAPHYYGRMRPI